MSTIAHTYEELSPDAAVGRRVHMLMWDRDLTQTKLAPAVGITQTNLSKKLKGRVGWSVGELIAVARELRTSVAYLVGETENRRPVKLDGGLGDSYTPRDSNPEPTD